MENLTRLTESELDAIISGVVDGVYPTTQETAMAHELKILRTQLAELKKRTVTNAIRAFVTDDDIKALERLAECCDDPESGGHDLEKEQVTRLEKIGALQRCGRISYITDFGDLVLSLYADPVPPAASQPADDDRSDALCDLNYAHGEPSGNPGELPVSARDVIAERQRQITAESWTPEHDDEHRDGELARAAACYAMIAARERVLSDGEYAASRRLLPFNWPWDPAWWKPTTPRRDLVKAGSLILAEIERIDRAAIQVEGE